MIDNADGDLLFENFGCAAISRENRSRFFKRLQLAEQQGLALARRASADRATESQ